MWCDNDSGNDNDYPSGIIERFGLPTEFTFSDEGVNLLIRFEGFSENPYNDGLDIGDPFYFDTDGRGKGNCTGGYGHKIHNGACDGRKSEERFLKISPSEALSILKADILKAEAAVKEHITVPVTQSQYDALVSLFFNWGYYLRYPEKINLINAGKHQEAGVHFLKGPISSGGAIMPGLVKRRYTEASMFLRGYNVILPDLSVYQANPEKVYYATYNDYFGK